jgi:hypothetical protein
MTGKRGAPSKSEDQKCSHIWFSVPRYIIEQFEKDVKDNNDDRNRAVQKFMLDYHDRTEAIENQEKIYLEKTHTLNEMQQDLKEFEEHIHLSKIMEAKSQERMNDDAYKLELQNVVTEIRRKPIDKQHIPERATRLSNKYGYHKKYIVQDIKNTIAEREEQTRVDFQISQLTQTSADIKE